MGIGPWKHVWKRMAHLKTYFRVKSSFFHLKGPYFSTRSVTNKLKNLFKEKEVGVTHQITGIWPKKHLQNPEKQFSSISYLKEFAESGLETVFLVAMKRLYKSVCPSVRPSVRMSVMLLLFGLLGATYAVHTALFWWNLAKTVFFCYFYEQIGFLQAYLGSNSHFLVGYTYII